jgi:hypothetical protein
MTGVSGSKTNRHYKHVVRGLCQPHHSKSSEQQDMPVLDEACMSSACF